MNAAEMTSINVAEIAYKAVGLAETAAANFAAVADMLSALLLIVTTTSAVVMAASLQVQTVEVKLLFFVLFCCMS
jgi:hypothetical protein